MKDDKYFLKKAVELGNTKKKPYNFATLVVKDGKIVAKNTGHMAHLDEPVAHDVASAIREAVRKLGRHDLSDCVLYCSHSPCVMCFTITAAAKIRRVVFAEALDEDGVGRGVDGVSVQSLNEELKHPVELVLLPL